MMSKIELKDLLIQQIRNTDNQTLLEEAGRLFNGEVDDLGVYQFSATELADIHEARTQIQNGESFTHEQANEIVNAWLRK